MAKFYAKAPDGSDALLSIVLTGFTQSLQQNGWCKLPNGLLFQWFEHIFDTVYYPPYIIFTNNDIYEYQENFTLPIEGTILNAMISKENDGYYMECTWINQIDRIANMQFIIPNNNIIPNSFNKRVNITCICV